MMEHRLLLKRIITFILLSQLKLSAATSPLLSKTGNIGGNSLFNAIPYKRSSGLVWIPDAISKGNGLLAGVSDEGLVYMINPDDDTEYYVSVIQTDNDFEGITFDPFLFNVQKHVYVIVEGGHILNNGTPELIRYSYTLTAPHTLNLVKECTSNLESALPCISWLCQGIESITLLTPSSCDTPAEFLIGMEGNGILYRVDETGASTGSCIDVTTAAGVPKDVSASQYDPSSGIVYTIYGYPKKIVATDVAQNCHLGDWPTMEGDYQGLAIRPDANKAYINTADQPSHIDVYDWLPTTLKTCSTPVTCSFTLCSGSGGGASQCKPLPCSTSAPSDSPIAEPLTSTPSDSPIAEPLTSAPSNSPIAEPLTSTPTDSPMAKPLTSAPTDSPLAKPPKKDCEGCEWWHKKGKVKSSDKKSCITKFKPKVKGQDGKCEAKGCEQENACTYEYNVSYRINSNICQPTNCIISITDAHPGVSPVIQTFNLKKNGKGNTPKINGGASCACEQKRIIFKIQCFTKGGSIATKLSNIDYLCTKCDNALLQPER